MLCLYCYAMLVDVDWVSESLTDVRLLFNGLFKVATLIHIWVDWLRHLEYPVLSVLGIPEYPCDYPMECHPGSKGS